MTFSLVDSSASTAIMASIPFPIAACAAPLNGRLRDGWQASSGGVQDARPDDAEDPMLQRAPILVFPAGMAAARRFAEAATARGEAVIGASSLAFDPARPGYADWARLPYYDAPDFAER